MQHRAAFKSVATAVPAIRADGARALNTDGKLVTKMLSFASARKPLLKCTKGSNTPLSRDVSKLFSVVPSNRTRGNGHKLKQRKLQLNPRKNFFTLRVTEPWPRLPREVMESPSLEIFKTRLDKVLYSLL